MAATPTDAAAIDVLPAQLARLRALYTLLASVPDGQRQDELIECTRAAIASVRKTRATLAAISRGLAATSPAFPND